MSNKMKKKAGIKAKSETVKVVMRVRPMSKKELANGRIKSVHIDAENATVSVSNPAAPTSQPKQFTFDKTYGADAKQQDIYDQTGAPIVEDVLKGFNGTIFCYGQTGAGKSFTMEGVPDNPTLRGIIPNSFRHIFDKIAVSKSDLKQFLVRASV